MAELKTQDNDGDVGAFLDGVDNPTRQADARAVVEMMSDITGENPRMWGTSIIGFGTYHYRYASGREAEWMVVGLSPRKQALTLYLMDGYEGRDELLARLGPHSIGKSCLYIKRLDKVDGEVLKELITDSVARVRDASP